MEMINKNALLVAGPTSGKTYLERTMERKGIAVTDTDALIEQIIPDYFRNRWYERSGPDHDFVTKMRDLIIARAVLDLGSKLVLTNLWGDDFLNTLNGKTGVKQGIFVFRANALDITKLSKQRGHALSTRLTSKWSVSAEKYAPKKFATIIWLPTDCYLADVVVPSSNGWNLTALGQSFAGKSRTEMLSFKFSRKEDNNEIV